MPDVMPWPTRPMYYRLVDRQAVPTTLRDWAFNFQTSRPIALDYIGEYRVSTIFLGLDNSFLGGPPMIFETATFDHGGRTVDMERCSTYDEAEAMHAKACKWAREQAAA